MVGRVKLAVGRMQLAVGSKQLAITVFGIPCLTDCISRQAGVFGIRYESSIPCG